MTPWKKKTTFKKIIRTYYDKRNECTHRNIQVFSSAFEYITTRETNIYRDPFRYCHQHSNTLRQEKQLYTKMLSGILINIRIHYDKRNGCIQRCTQVFSSIFESPYGQGTRMCMGCIQMHSDAFQL
jgi:hypothetical protein